MSRRDLRRSRSALSVSTEGGGLSPGYAHRVGVLLRGYNLGCNLRGLISRGLSPAFVTRLPFRDAAEHRVNTVDIEHNAVTVFTRSVAFIVSQTTNSDSSDVR